MMQVLVLRPEPAASASVHRARELGLDAVSAPLFEIEPLPWQAPEVGSFDGLLLTSANAIAFGGRKVRRLRALKVHAVGEATAAAARKIGFEVVSTGDRGVDRLLGSLQGDLKLLHLCGEERRQPEHARQEIRPLAVYRAAEVEAPDLSRANGSVALIHSPRAGRRFAELVENRATIVVAAISATAAASVGQGWRSVEVAHEPTDEALLALASSLCNKPEPE